MQRTNQGGSPSADTNTSICEFITWSFYFNGKVCGAPGSHLAMTNYYAGKNETTFAFFSTDIDTTLPTLPQRRNFLTCWTLPSSISLTQGASRSSRCESSKDPDSLLSCLKTRDIQYSYQGCHLKQWMQWMLNFQVISRLYRVLVI